MITLHSYTITLISHKVSKPDKGSSHLYECFMLMILIWSTALLWINKEVWIIQQFCFRVLVQVTSKPLVLLEIKPHLWSVIRFGCFCFVFLSLLVCARPVKGAGHDCGDMYADGLRVPVLHKLVGCLLVEVKRSESCSLPAIAEEMKL